jgi:UDP-N-acetylmuramate--alanine ligase
VQSSKYKIGIFMGGKSIEREVSFNSGRTIYDHLDTERFIPIPIFQNEDGKLYILPLHFIHRGKISDFQKRLPFEAQKILWSDLPKLVDFMYIATHGRYGEDGTLQGFLEVLNIPYLGTKVLGSALGMNKAMHKKNLASYNVKVPQWFTLTPQDINQLSPKIILKKIISKNINFPLVIKPVHEGSSLGIQMVFNEKEFLLAIKKATNIYSHKQQNVIVEERIQGKEFVCVSMQEKHKNNHRWRSFPLTQVIIDEKHTIFDYEQKYMPGCATKLTPAPFSEKDTQNIFNVCHKVSELLHFKTISRIDGILTNDGTVYIIDPNSLTGMAPTTFLFHQAAEIGMSHTQLINLLIEREMENHGFTFTSFINPNNKKILMKKLRIAVLLGGNSQEKEISLESGRNVCYKLSPQKYEVIPIFVDSKMNFYKLTQKLLIKNTAKDIEKLVTKKEYLSYDTLENLCDFVFIGLHGGKGENGSIQGMLEMLNIPYNGSGVLASALCMDKFQTNTFLKDNGFEVPQSFLLNKKSFEQKLFLEELQQNKLSFPLIVKPHDDGCSILVHKVTTEKELTTALSNIFNMEKQYALVEEYMQGTELTCGVYGNNEVITLPPSQTVAKNAILSIKEKFLPGEGSNITPAQLPSSSIKLVQTTVKNAYKIVECKGYARIDCFHQNKEQSPTNKERVVILEVNTLPALTPATCLFHQAAEAGIKPMEFIDMIVEMGLQEHQHKIKFLNVKQSPVVEKSVL